ncbi:MAG: tRNA uracil 4-sulfurtransferase ThiI [Bacteriovoracia bacterium]
MYNTLIINTSEIWIKKKNRRNFYDLLKKHIRHRVKRYHQDSFEVVMESHKIVIISQSIFNQDVIDILAYTPGIHSIELVRKVEQNYEAILPVLSEEIKSWGDDFYTFKVQTKRSDKRFPINSMELSANLGEHILKNFSNFKVRIKKPDVIVSVKVMPSGIFVSTKRTPGLKGLPVGSSGRLVSMLSGGFDSPVSSSLMATRGCDLSYAFFYAYPFVGSEVKDKIIELLKVLSRTQRFSPLYIIPFGKIQQKIAENCKPSFRTLLIRKAMIECSTILANRINALGLVTGDALGQVSSQTLENIRFLDKSAPIPILRPLIGMTKEEIISLAHKFKTHDISIIPHDDACALFAPDHPVLKASDEYWDYYNQKIDIADDLSQALNEAEVYTINKYGELIKR